MGRPVALSASRMAAYRSRIQLDRLARQLSYLR